MHYIEVTLQDIAAANTLAHEVLGRSLDELPPQTRRLLMLLKQMVEKRCESAALEPEDCLFTRREVRDFSGWSNTQLKVHLDRLEDLEYILPHCGMRGSAYEYELLFDGDTDTEKPQLIGLIDLQKLDYDAEFTGWMAEFAGQNAPKTGGSPNYRWAQSRQKKGLTVQVPQNHEMHKRPLIYRWYRSHASERTGQPIEKRPGG